MCMRLSSAEFSIVEKLTAGSINVLNVTRDNLDLRVSCRGQADGSSLVIAEMPPSHRSSRISLRPKGLLG